MDSFDDLTDGEPPAIDPYEVLGLERFATADQIKSAYRKEALRSHPGTDHTFARAPGLLILLTEP